MQPDEVRLLTVTYGQLLQPNARALLISDLCARMGLERTQCRLRGTLAVSALCHRIACVRVLCVWVCVLVEGPAALSLGRVSLFSRAVHLSLTLSLRLATPALLLSVVCTAAIDGWSQTYTTGVAWTDIDNQAIFQQLVAAAAAQRVRTIQFQLYVPAAVGAVGAFNAALGSAAPLPTPSVADAYSFASGGTHMANSFNFSAGGPVHRLASTFSHAAASSTFNFGAATHSGFAGAGAAATAGTGMTKAQKQ